MRNGGTCILRDDMANILNLYQKADVFVLATPVYFYGISARMKTSIDRIYPIWQHLGKKDVYYTISAGLGKDIVEKIIRRSRWFCRTFRRIYNRGKTLCDRSHGCRSSKGSRYI